MEKPQFDYYESQIRFKLDIRETIKLDEPNLTICSPFLCVFFFHFFSFDCRLLHILSSLYVSKAMTLKKPDPEPLRAETHLDYRAICRSAVLLVLQL